MSRLENVSSMSNYELLNIGSEISLNNEIINEEWFKRHRMNFPYTLDHSGNIVHSILREIIPDKNCDKLILDQANEIRKKKH